jgi:superfamily II DNA or RNA helicase
LNQFADRIRKFLDIEPGVFGGGIKELRDVTVATVQTLTRCVTDHLEDFFGMVILDEAHHCPAVTFQDIVQRFPAFYRFGLTATPERKDRLHPVLYDCVGPIFYRINPFELTETGDIIKPDVVRIDTEFRHGFRRFRTDYQKMIRRLTLDQKRNGLIADIIKKTHRGRSLVITERIEHAHILHELLKGIFREKVAIIIGATGREQREEVFQSMISGNIQILISTMSLVGEGFDLKELDSLYLTVPTGNIQRATQVIGRILRPSPGKTKAIIYDFVDSQSPVLHAQWKKRRSVYAGFQK